MDFVWYATEAGQSDMAPKLPVPFQGPYLILQKLSVLDYKIQLDAKGKQKVVDQEKLRPYDGVYTLPWASTSPKNSGQERCISGELCTMCSTCSRFAMDD